MKKQYTKIKKIEASIIELDKVEDIAYNAVVKVNTLGENFIGQVVKIDDDTVTVEVFGNTQDFSLNDIVVEFEEKPLEIPLNESILGRTFNGIARP
ncbi:MAG: V-type ATP synthase subunit B, partial [Anaerococcus vaginalis]